MSRALEFTIGDFDELHSVRLKFVENSLQLVSPHDLRMKNGARINDPILLIDPQMQPNGKARYLGLRKCLGRSSVCLSSRQNERLPATALQYAIVLKRMDMVVMLLSLGADPDGLPADDSTALMGSCPTTWGGAPSTMQWFHHPWAEEDVIPSARTLAEWLWSPENGALSPNGSNQNFFPTLVDIVNLEMTGMLSGSSPRGGETANTLRRLIVQQVGPVTSVQNSVRAMCKGLPREAQVAIFHLMPNTEQYYPQSGDSPSHNRPSGDRRQRQKPSSPQLTSAFSSAFSREPRGSEHHVGGLPPETDTALASVVHQLPEKSLSAHATPDDLLEVGAPLFEQPTGPDIGIPVAPGLEKTDESKSGKHSQMHNGETEMRATCESSASRPSAKVPPLQDISPKTDSEPSDQRLSHRSPPEMRASQSSGPPISHDHTQKGNSNALLCSSKPVEDTKQQGVSHSTVTLKTLDTTHTPDLSTAAPKKIPEDSTQQSQRASQSSTALHDSTPKVNPTAVISPKATEDAKSRVPQSIPTAKQQGVSQNTVTLKTLDTTQKPDLSSAAPQKIPEGSTQQSQRASQSSTALKLHDSTPKVNPTAVISPKTTEDAKSRVPQSIPTAKPTDLAPTANNPKTVISPGVKQPTQRVSQNSVVPNPSSSVVAPKPSKNTLVSNSSATPSAPPKKKATPVVVTHPPTLENLSQSKKLTTERAEHPPLVKDRSSPSQRSVVFAVESVAETMSIQFVDQPEGTPSPSQQGRNSVEFVEVSQTQPVVVPVAATTTVSPNKPQSLTPQSARKETPTTTTGSVTPQFEVEGQQQPMAPTPPLQQVKSARGIQGIKQKRTSLVLESLKIHSSDED